MASIIKLLWRMGYLALYLLYTVSALTTATCYQPDGSPIDSAYQPCNGTAEVSMCCHLGIPNNNGDACGSGSTYGLCGITGTQLWRESCTDPTWKSPACLKLCINGKDDQMITACSDGSYCCGQNNATCCDSGQGVYIVSNQVSPSPAAFYLSTAVSSLSSSSSTTISSGTSSTTSSSTASTYSSSSTNSTTFSSASSASSGAVAGATSRLTPSSNPSLASTTATSDSGSLSSATKVTLIVSVTLGFVAIVALLAAVYFWRRSQTSKVHSPQLVTRAYGAGLSEMGSENSPVEMYSYKTQDYYGARDGSVNRRAVELACV